jgi:hypothetical protein
MADLRSDRRLLLTVSDSGHVLRDVVIDAAVGFVDVDDSTRTMLGLIDSGRCYLGFYDWSWEGGSGSPPKTNHPSREGETR